MDVYIIAGVRTLAEVFSAPYLVFPPHVWGPVL